MKAISNSDLARFINDLPLPSEPFKPTATYDPDGDCIEFLFNNDDYFAERIDDLVTVYYSRETNDLIGSVVKNISLLRKKHPNAVAISVEDGHIKLRHLFVVAATLADDVDAHVFIYKKLIKAAEESDASADLCGAVG